MALLENRIQTLVHNLPIGRRAANNSTNSSSAFGSLISTSYLETRESGLTSTCQNFGLIIPESRHVEREIGPKSMVSLASSKYAVQNNVQFCE
jgi:hypothetical protein